MIRTIRSCLAAPARLPPVFGHHHGFPTTIQCGETSRVPRATESSGRQSWADLYTFAGPAGQKSMTTDP